MIRSIEVTRTYLQMMSVDELKPAKLADDSVHVDRFVECPSFVTCTQLGATITGGATWLDGRADSRIPEQTEYLFVVLYCRRTRWLLRAASKRRWLVEIVLFG